MFTNKSISRVVSVLFIVVFMLPAISFQAARAEESGGTYNFGSSSPQIRNTIFRGNTAINKAQIFNRDKYNEIINPAIITVEPISAPNDLDTSITITGTNFSDTPTVSLGSVALTHVTWVDSATLTATMPWGIDPGVYSLSVVNPNGGTSSLPNAFTVTQGIGQWKGGNLFGGDVHQILMKPGDPNTLYALAYGIVGLFRSQDAAEHWSFVSADVAINNSKFAIDPLHPDWIYGFDYKGLHRSQDEGETWTTVMPNIWPDGRSMNSPQVYVSPYNRQVLFVGSSESYGSPYSAEAFGLIKSTNGGTSWQIVANL